MLRHLESYAARNGLNSQRAEILYNWFSCLPEFCSSYFLSLQSGAWREIILPTSGWEYSLTSPWSNLHHGASHALRSFNAAIRRVEEFANPCQSLLFAIIIIILPLCHYYHYYIYAFYLLLYLLLSISLANPLQVAHMAFFKRILRVKSTSANWCVLWECAQEPWRFHWFRSAVKFWNRMFDSTFYAMWWKQLQVFPLEILVLLIVGLERWRMPLVICRMALYIKVTSYITGTKLNISNLRIDLRFLGFS